jgi:alcohol dehydrogenase class IV
MFKEQKNSLILGVGGGSVLDTAKLIRFFSSYSGTPVSGSYKKIEEVPPLLLFPTTAGSGSEATHFAVCYVNNRKYSVIHNDILPSESFIDYRFTLSASPYLTACTGIDALSQAIESYWSNKSTKESRKYAKEAIKLIFPSLQECIISPTPKIREKIAKGAHFSGKAINISFTTAAHAYSYGITMHLNVPHGHAVACGLPFFFAKNLEVAENNCNDKRGVSFVKDRMYELCYLLGFNVQTAVDQLKDYISNIFCNIKKIEKPDKDTWNSIISSVNIERLENNPTKIFQNPNINDFIW